MANNPIMFIDPDGMRIEYHKDNSFWLNTGIKLRIFFHSIFGSKEIKNLIKRLKSTENIHTIKQETGLSYLGNNAQPRSLYDYEENALLTLPNVPSVDATPEDWKRYNEIMENYENNRPNKHRDGTGDGSYITLNYEGGATEEEKNLLLL